MNKKDTLEKLRSLKSGLKDIDIMIGIDAFVDKIVRAVKSKKEDGSPEFFSDISEFGNYLTTKSGMSCGIELDERFMKLGGNAPIMANALGKLGVNVHCISSIGYPEIDPVFKELEENCTLVTIGNPGYTTALEFEDGKIMLSQRTYLDKLNFEKLEEIVGLDALKKYFDTCKLIGLVNWNGIIQFNDIFRGILSKVIKDKQKTNQILFFDFADFGARTKADVMEAIDLLEQFNNHYKVILGFNENEAIYLYKMMINKDAKSFSDIGDELFSNLKLDSLVIHTLTSSKAWEEGYSVEVPSLYTKKPKLSTGGGDNFNAGLCLGELLDLDPESCLYAANATSGYYVRNAKSPTIDDLIATIENFDNMIEKL